MATKKERMSDLQQSVPNELPVVISKYVTCVVSYGVTCVERAETSEGISSQN